MKTAKMFVVLMLMATPSFADVSGNDFLALGESQKVFYLVGVANTLSDVVDVIAKASRDVKRPAPTTGDEAVSIGSMIGLGANAAYLRILREIQICTPEGSTYAQDIKVVVKWMNNNPEVLHKNASALIIKALQDAYPCK